MTQRSPAPVSLCENEMPNRTRSSTEDAWLPQMIAAIDEGVIITDAQGRTTWVNPGFTRLCGYSLAELQGQTPGSVLQGSETNPTTVAQVRSALQQQHACAVDLLNYHKDGHPYWVALHIIPLYDPAGTLVRFAATARDITARMQVEQTLRQHLGTVEQRPASVQPLPDLITRCAWCQRMRDQQGQWQRVETYLGQHGSTVTHGMCATCGQTVASSVAAPSDPQERR